MRLIDANKLKAHYEWWDFSDDDDRRNKHIFDSIVDLQPTADVVEVVRCKDCKFYNEAERMCNDTNGFDRYWKPTDFCSYGKRRE